MEPKTPSNSYRISMPPTALAAFAFLLWAGSVSAQSDPILASRAEYAEAVKAYQAHDTAGFLEHAAKAESLRPDHGGVLYALASAYALKGEDAEAIETLQRFAALGYFADAAADSDLARLRSTPGFAEVRRALEAAASIIARSSESIAQAGRRTSSTPNATASGHRWE